MKYLLIIFLIFLNNCSLNQDSQYLLLRSPIMIFPTISADWKLGQAFTFNLGVSFGYNTVVNDYGERGKTFSILFGTYF